MKKRKIWESVPMDGWDEVLTLLENNTTEDFVAALAKAEDLFQKMLFAKTGRENIAQSLVEVEGEFRDLPTLLDARRVYYELTQGQGEELLDQDTVEDLLSVYFQGLVDLEHPDSEVEENKVPWVWIGIAVGVVVIIFVVLFTGLGQSFLTSLQPLFSGLLMVLLTVIALGVVVLTTFAVLDYQRKKSKRKL